MGAVALMSSSVPEHGNYKGVTKGSGKSIRKKCNLFLEHISCFSRYLDHFLRVFSFSVQHRSPLVLIGRRACLVAGKKLVSAGAKYKGFPGTAQRSLAG